MRTPSSLFLSGATEAIGRLRADEVKAVRQAASGRRLERPSADPEGSARTVGLRSDLAALSATAVAAAHGKASLDAADSSLAAMTATVEEVQRLGSQGATDLVSPEGRRALAAGIRAAADTLLAEGNRRAEGYSLFAGARTTSDAFTRAADSSFVYQGDTIVRSLDMNGVAAALNVPGDAVLAGPVNAGAALEALAQAVEAGDVQAATAALTEVEGLRRQVVEARAGLGLAAARVEQGLIGLLQRSEKATVALAEVEDADLLEVAGDLERIRLFLGAALASTKGMAEQPSLFQMLA